MIKTALSEDCTLNCKLKKMTPPQVVISEKLIDVLRVHLNDVLDSLHIQAYRHFRTFKITPEGEELKASL